jgi:DNA-binding PadR family transcriptional regulator
LVVSTAEKLRGRVIKSFMDILILTELKKQSMSGYDVMGLLHKRFDVLVSSGTVYSLLYSLEREGLIKGVQNQRTRVYELTEKGERDIKVINKANEEIQGFLKNISLLNAT